MREDLPWSVEGVEARIRKRKGEECDRGINATLSIGKV